MCRANDSPQALLSNSLTRIRDTSIVDARRHPTRPHLEERPYLVRIVRQAHCGTRPLELADWGAMGVVVARSRVPPGAHPQRPVEGAAYRRRGRVDAKLLAEECAELADARWIGKVDGRVVVGREAPLAEDDRYARLCAHRPRSGRVAGPKAGGGG